ncbi:MAG TPA: ATP-binding protein [Candidatus Methanofastidiosa archaeon]|nr:ATP-binding protein [Candidatus Methanofastidiosa archaeon]
MIDLSILKDGDILSLLNRQMADGIRIDHSNIIHDGLDLGDRGDVDLFLKEFSSLLNTNGGTLIYGVNDPAWGIAITDKDYFLVALRRIIKKNLDPKVPEDHYGVRFIDLPDGRYVVIVQAPKSDLGPHAVRVGESAYTFYKRDMELRPLDMHSLRRELIGSSYVGDVKEFVGTRALELSEGRGSVPLMGSGKILIEVVPWPSLKNGIVLRHDMVDENLRALDWTDDEWMPTIEGLLGYHSNHSYISFRNDLVLEAAESFKMKPRRDGSKVFDFVAYQNDIKKLLEGYLGTIRNLDVSIKSFFVSISLIGIKGYEMGLKMPGKKTRFDQDVLTLPIRPFDSDSDNVMMFVNSYIDILWNSSGD